jgi:hypothetical protein
MKATPSLAIGFGLAILVEATVLHLMLEHHPAWRFASLALSIASLLWLVGQVARRGGERVD